MKGDEEFEALKEQRDLRNARQPNENSACLVAVWPSESLEVRESKLAQQSLLLAWEINRLERSLVVAGVPLLDGAAGDWGGGCSGHT